MRKIAIIIIVVLIAYASRSCILEDRGDCPVYLTLKFIEPPSGIEDVFLVFKYRDGMVLKDTISGEEMEGCEIPLRKGHFSLAAFANVGNMVYDDGYMIPVGSEADSIYTDFRQIFCEGDLHTDTVSLHKDYIDLHIRMLGYGENYDSVYLAVNSSAVGYDLAGDVKNGSYRYIPEPVAVPDSSGNCYEYQSRVLRQRNGDLSIEIYACIGERVECVKTIDVSSALPALERDGREMEDIYLLIDVSKSAVAVTPEDWDCMDYVEIEM